MGSLGLTEMVAIFVVALLLFGPKKLPELGRTLGKALTEFRRAKNELKATFDSHLSELDREVNLQSISAPSTNYSSPDYSYSHGDYGSYDSDYHSPSVPYETNGSHEASTSQPTTASATAPQDAEAHRDHPSSQESPVAGTVSRSTGVQPVESGSLATEEKHSA
jgi:sec-independent protein translocase protein TatA